MTQKLIAVRIWLDKTVEGRRDAGQGTLEYVGMIIVAALVIVAVVGVLSPARFSSALTTAVNSVLP